MYRDTILKRLDQIDDIPTMLTIAMEIDRLTHDANTSASDISNIIRLDPALTGKVLKIANSAIYASAQRIISLQQAITRLGFPEIRRIALSIAFINSFKNVHVNYERFWIHSITTAYIAVNLQKISKKFKTIDELFSCGILHDIGVLILDQYFPDIYKKVFEIAANRRFELQLVEKKVLGITHSEVGAHLLTKWKLPENITDVVYNHHQPQLSANHSLATKYIYLSNFISNNRGIDNGTTFFPEGFYDDIWDDLNLAVDDIPELIDNVLEEVEKAKQVLKLGGK